MRDRRDAEELSWHGLRVAQGLLGARLDRLLAGAFTNTANQRLAKQRSHRNYVHPKVGKPITIAGALGDDAKRYQVRAVQLAIEESKS